MITLLLAVLCHAQAAKMAAPKSDLQQIAIETLTGKVAGSPLAIMPAEPEHPSKDIQIRIADAIMARPAGYAGQPLPHQDRVDMQNAIAQSILGKVK